jgi:hypothetical protein
VGGRGQAREGSVSETKVKSAKPQRLSCITFAALYWSKQVTGPAIVKEKENRLYLLMLGW